MSELTSFRIKFFGFPFPLFHRQCVAYLPTSLLLPAVLSFIVASDFSDLYLSNREMPFVLFTRATLQMPRNNSYRVIRYFSSRQLQFYLNSIIVYLNNGGIEKGKIIYLIKFSLPYLLYF